MANDRVLRLDPKTGRITEYLLPRSANIWRRVYRQSTTPSRFEWATTTSIMRLEPLD